VNPYTKVRQADSLRSALGSRYRLADTGKGPDGTNRLCENFVLYQPSQVKLAGSGGHWQIDSDRLATYQPLASVRTGARFLFVAVHLVAPKGRSYDQARAEETTSLVGQAQAYAARHGITSIVIAGDFNAYPGRRGSSDTPGKVLGNSRFADALRVAQSVRNSSYNSINEYKRTPPRRGGSVDHVFVSPGVGVSSWQETLRLSHGQFVGVIPSDHNPVSSTIVLPY
jgi:endonuclease/exonuclease/phosphatase family metal-dependent hydrolase